MFYSKCVLFFLVAANILSAQADSRHEHRLEEASKTIYEDVNKGEKAALSVLNSVSDPKTRVFSLLVLAEAEQLRGNFVASLNHLYNAENLSVLSGEECLIATVSLELSGFYKTVGLEELADEKLKSLIKDNSCGNSADYKFRLEFESALNESGQEKINILNKLSKEINPDVFSLEILKQKIRMELANAYQDVNPNDSAVIYYEYLIRSQIPVFTAKARLGLTQMNINQFENLIKADSLLQIHSDVETRKSVSKLLANDYLKRGNKELYKLKTVQFNEFDAFINQNKKEARDLVIAHIENQDEENQSANVKYVILFSILILVTACGFIYYFKTKRDYQKFLKLMEDKHQIAEPKIQSIPEQTEQLLLQKLNKFERSNKFIQPGISLTSLAKSLDTNTKYLSDVINRNKEVNFNQYINELRINYIINKMKEEPKYLNYKMYYLAEECGFSSQSTFSSVFKSVTGISPLSFIKFMKNERKA